MNERMARNKMKDKRYNLILKESARQIDRALWERETFGEPKAPDSERVKSIRSAIGEIIRYIRVYGLYPDPIDWFGTSYEYLFDGPVVLDMASGRTFHLFAVCFFEATGRRVSDIWDWQYRYMPGFQIQEAFQTLRGHKILDIGISGGTLWISLDGNVTIESYDWLLGEFSAVSLRERIG